MQNISIKIPRAKLETNKAVLFPFTGNKIINNIYQCNLIIVKKKHSITKDKTLFLDIKTEPIKKQLQELKQYSNNIKNE